MLPWVYGSGPAPEALRGEDDDGVLNTAADHDVSGLDSQQQQQVCCSITHHSSLSPLTVKQVPCGIIKLLGFVPYSVLTPTRFTQVPDE